MRGTRRDVEPESTMPDERLHTFLNETASLHSNLPGPLSCSLLECILRLHTHIIQAAWVCQSFTARRLGVHAPAISSVSE